MPGTRGRAARAVLADPADPIDPTDVAALVRGYVERGFFQSARQVPRRGRATVYSVVWHHRRTFRLVIDTEARTVSFPDLLPGVSARSAMMKELTAFLHQFETTEVPDHRRIDPSSARLKVGVRRGHVSLALEVKRQRYEYGVRRLVHLAHEIFMVFLPDGPYDEYRVSQLGVDPEAVWS